METHADLDHCGRNDVPIGIARHIRALSFRAQHNERDALRLEVDAITQAVLYRPGDPARDTFTAPTILVRQAADGDRAAGIGQKFAVLEVIHVGPDRAGGGAQVVPNRTAQASGFDTQR